MGADVKIEHGMVHAYVAGRNGKLKGAKICLTTSVGATETLMMAATLAEGETTLENAAQEPEVVDLANFCPLAGAKIGSNTIAIEGVRSLHSVDTPSIQTGLRQGRLWLGQLLTRIKSVASGARPSDSGHCCCGILSAVIAEAPQPLRHSGTKSQGNRY